MARKLLQEIRALKLHMQPFNKSTFEPKRDFHIDSNAEE